MKHLKISSMFWFALLFYSSRIYLMADDLSRLSLPAGTRSLALPELLLIYWSALGPLLFGFHRDEDWMDPMPSACLLPLPLMFALLITSMFRESFIETTSSFSFASKSSRTGYPFAPAAARFESALSARFRLLALPDSICSLCM